MSKRRKRIRKILERQISSNANGEEFEKASSAKDPSKKQSISPLAQAGAFIPQAASIRQNPVAWVTFHSPVPGRGTKACVGPAFMAYPQSPFPRDWEFHEARV